MRFQLQPKPQLAISCLATNNNVLSFFHWRAHDGFDAMLKGQYHTSHLDSFVRDKDLLRGWNIVLLQSTVLCEMLDITTDHSFDRQSRMATTWSRDQGTNKLHTYIQAAVRIYVRRRKISHVYVYTVSMCVRTYVRTCLYEVRQTYHRDSIISRWPSKAEAVRRLLASNSNSCLIMTCVSSETVMSL